jgi:ribosome-associated protein
MATITRPLLIQESLAQERRTFQSPAYIDPRLNQNYNSLMTERVLVQPVEQARLAVDVASDKQASDVVMLDIRGLSDFADYFVILTGESQRQLRALAEDLETALKGTGATLHHREGSSRSAWMLLDFGDLIIHIFGPEGREYYNIEGAWAKAIEVVRIQ